MLRKGKVNWYSAYMEHYCYGIMIILSFNMSVIFVSVTAVQGTADNIKYI